MNTNTETQSTDLDERFDKTNKIVGEIVSPLINQRAYKSTVSVDNLEMLFPNPSEKIILFDKTILFHKIVKSIFAPDIQIINMQVDFFTSLSCPHIVYVLFKTYFPSEAELKELQISNAFINRNVNTNSNAYYEISSVVNYGYLHFDATNVNDKTMENITCHIENIENTIHNLLLSEYNVKLS